jgi:UrcA family protein
MSKEAEMNKTLATATRAITICIAANLGCNVANASPGSPSNDQSVTDAPLKYVVIFSDLDLSRIEGATTLHARLRHAARVVCDPLESRDMGLVKKYKACVGKAVADAVATVNRPLLTQYDQSHPTGETSRPAQFAKAH